MTTRGRTTSFGLLSAFAISACGAGSRSQQAELANASEPAPASQPPAELCGRLEHVIAAAPSKFESLRGAPLPFPTELNPDVPHGHWASTLTVPGGEAVVLFYSWHEWQLEFPGAAFTQRDLDRAILACPAVAGWERDTVSEVIGLQHQTVAGLVTVFLGDGNPPSVVVHLESK